MKVMVRGESGNAILTYDLCLIFQTIRPTISPITVTKLKEAEMAMISSTVKP